jgi:hypothetical protein
MVSNLNVHNPHTEGTIEIQGINVDLIISLREVVLIFNSISVTLIALVTTLFVTLVVNLAVALILVIVFETTSTIALSTYSAFVSRGRMECDLLVANLTVASCFAWTPPFRHSIGLYFPLDLWMRWQYPLNTKP